MVVSILNEHQIVLRVIISNWLQQIIFTLEHKSQFSFNEESAYKQNYTKSFLN